MSNTSLPNADQQQSLPINKTKSSLSRKSSISSDMSSSSTYAPLSTLFTKARPNFQPRHDSDDSDEQSTSIMPNFNFKTNYREALNQDDDNISPSSSNTSLASYFKRHNSASSNSIFHSITHKRSNNSVYTSSASSTHSNTKNHLRPSFALNKIKNSVINTKKNKKQVAAQLKQLKHQISDFPLAKFPRHSMDESTTLSKHSSHNSIDSSKSQPSQKYVYTLKYQKKYIFFFLLFFN